MNDACGHIFRFKQFVIRQDRAAMKVGFDGVLLGAWSDVTGVRRALDVGTGTGLLALMIAQRIDALGEEAVIEAVEVDTEAVANARENVSASPWAAWCTVHAGPLQAFQAADRYDLVICNPPFFQEGQRSPRPNRARARHADALPWPELCRWVSSRLSASGRLAVIVPTAFVASAEMLAQQQVLFCRRRCLVRSLPGRAPHRALLEFAPASGAVVEEPLLTIERRRHEYSAEFAALTEDFYWRTARNDGGEGRPQDAK